MQRLEVERAWMVGDTTDDVLAAARAGAVPFGVIAPGDDSRDRLLAAGAVRVLETLAEIEPLLP
jgi:phosphoglycolate phosphatase-like HAD superfamily hydrolase